MPHARSGVSEGGVFLSGTPWVSKGSLVTWKSGEAEGGTEGRAGQTNTEGDSGEVWSSKFYPSMYSGKNPEVSHRHCGCCVAGAWYLDWGTSVFLAKKGLLSFEPLPHILPIASCAHSGLLRAIKDKQDPHTGRQLPGSP